eukprot:6210534-Pleurochrysis_carterae.AAC.3
MCGQARVERTKSSERRTCTSMRLQGLEQRVAVLKVTEAAAAAAAGGVEGKPRRNQTGGLHCVQSPPSGVEPAARLPDAVVCFRLKFTSDRPSHRFRLYVVPLQHCLPRKKAARSRCLPLHASLGAGRLLLAPFDDALLASRRERWSYHAVATLQKHVQILPGARRIARCRRCTMGCEGVACNAICNTCTS